MSGLTNNRASYEVHDFENNKSPSISAEVLDKMESGIKEAVENRAQLPEIIDDNLQLNPNGWKFAEDGYYHNTLSVSANIDDTTIQELFLSDSIEVNKKREQENAIIEAGGQLYDGGLDLNHNIIIKSINKINIPINFKMVIQGKSSGKGFTIINLNLKNNMITDKVNSICLSISNKEPYKIDSQNWELCTGESIVREVSSKYLYAGSANHQLQLIPTQDQNENAQQELLNEIIYNNRFNFYCTFTSVDSSNIGKTNQIQFYTTTSEGAPTPLNTMYTLGPDKKISPPYIFLYNNSAGMWFADDNKNLYKVYKTIENEIRFDYQCNIPISYNLNGDFTLVGEHQGYIYILAQKITNGNSVHNIFEYFAFNISKKTWKKLNFTLPNTNNCLSLKYLQQRDGTKVPLILSRSCEYLYYLSFKRGAENPFFETLPLPDMVQNKLQDKGSSYLNDCTNRNSKGVYFRAQTSYFLNCFNSNYIETNGDICFWIDIPVYNNEGYYYYYQIFGILDESYNLNYEVKLQQFSDFEKLENYVKNNIKNKWIYLKDKEYLLETSNTDNENLVRYKITYSNKNNAQIVSGFNNNLETKQEVFNNYNDFTFYNAFPSNPGIEFRDADTYGQSWSNMPNFSLDKTQLNISYNYSSHHVTIPLNIIENLYFEFPENFEPKQSVNNLNIDSKYKTVVRLDVPAYGADEKKLQVIAYDDNGTKKDNGYITTLFVPFYFKDERYSYSNAHPTLLYYNKTKFDDYNKFGNNFISYLYKIVPPKGTASTPNINPVKDTNDVEIAYYWIKVRED